jgi:glycosyltransferase AglD
MLVLLSFIGFVAILHTLPFTTLFVSYFIILVVIIIAVTLLVRRFSIIASYTKGLKQTIVSGRGLLILGLVFLSWLCEGAVIYTIMKIFSNALSALGAVWLNSVSVISGLFQVTPGGLATYESVMSIALVKIGFSIESAYHLAILSHGYKFLFSFVVGFIAFILVPLTWKEIKIWIRNGVKGEETN